MISPMIDVSIVIVCMDNWDNLSRCLDSIRANTSVTYEVLVTAYLFSKENLDRLKSGYPWVKIVESDEIRGFSENNNLALRQAVGRYCFVLNDDTELRSPAIDRLVSAMDAQPYDTAVMSPVLLNPDGTVQVCGRPPMNWRTYMLMRLHLWDETRQTRYVGHSGIFRTYNIIGAAFLIRTDIFRECGWFDERYFFTPEDIALSTLLNRKGYRCMVDTEASLIHFGGMSGLSPSMVQSATIPAAAKGDLEFYSGGNILGRMVLGLFIFIVSGLTIPFNYYRQFRNPKARIYRPMIVGYGNVLKSIFSRKSPKEIFITYYKKLK